MSSGDDKLPSVDERLVMPGSRFEIVDGEVEYVPPSDEVHGRRRSQVSALVESHAADGYDVASDMLTRTAVTWDIAADASVYPAAPDPETGGRQLEELAFEVVSTERLAHAGRKARALTDRGVRRVFAVDVERKRALEWSRQTDAWEILSTDGVIDDRALAVPLPIRPLVEAAKADDAIAAALVAKKNPVIVAETTRARREGERKGKREGKVEGKREGKREGQREGQRNAVLRVLAARGLSVPAAVEARIRAEGDEATLDRWLTHAVTVARAADLLG